MNPNPPAPFRVIIVEDLPGAREDVEELLAQQPGFTLIGSCATVRESLSLLKIPNQTCCYWISASPMAPVSTSWNKCRQFSVKSLSSLLTKNMPSRPFAMAPLIK